MHTLSAGFTRGAPGLQEKAVANSGMFTTTPLMRYFAGECGSVMARARRSSGRSFCAGPLREADEEALVRSQTIAVGKLHVLVGILPRDVGQNRAAQVGDIFTFGQL